MLGVGLPPVPVGAESMVAATGDVAPLAASLVRMPATRAET